jgi:penicillin-binding protein 1B
MARAFRPEPLKKQAVQPRFRRKSLWRRVVTPRRIAALGILSVLGLGVFTYFYFRYSRLIDAKLRGEVMIRTSGIYAQPRIIKTGQPYSVAEIRAYLTDIGYVEAAKAEDARRGRYAIAGQTMTVEPGESAIIDKAVAFPALQLTFSRSGESIVRIVDKASGKAIPSAQLEPELLTALSNAEQEKRQIVQFRDVPKHLRDALVAVEDRRFFEHNGVDYRGLARAVWINVTNKELSQGGSTITQQLVKNMFLTPEKTYKRKLQEAFLSIVLETRLSKEEIFALYCNEIFLGQQGNYSVNGFAEASRAYFNKNIEGLTLPESAFLAGIIRGPSYYSPYSHAERAVERRNQVLDAMVETGAVPAPDAEAAKATPLGVQPRRLAANANAPYFVDFMQKELGGAFSESDLSRQSVRIYSSIDLDLQRAAENAVRDTLGGLDKIYASRKKDPVPPGTLQAALVAMDPRTGEVLAMVGGRDYEASQLNRVTDANRQPGSAFKPVVYAAAIDTAFSHATREPLTAASMFLDAPEKFVYGTGETYEPGNYGDRYSNREVSMRYALTHSLNVVTVRVAEQVGIGQIQQTAQKLGFRKPPSYPSIALGVAEATPLEVAQAYTAFANLGQRVAPTGLVRVTNAGGTTVKGLQKTTATALQPPVAFIVTNILEDVIDRGTAAGARERGFRAKAAGKTGTSRDGWFAGFTPNLVCVVYVGFDDGSQLGLEGAKSALPIWTDFMKAAVRLRPELAGDGFPRPDEGVAEVEIDPESGGLAVPGCPSRRKEFFVEGTQPKAPCPVHDFGPSPEPLDPAELPGAPNPAAPPPGGGGGTPPPAEPPSPLPRPGDRPAEPGDRPRRVTPHQPPAGRPA